MSAFKAKLLDELKGVVAAGDVRPPVAEAVEEVAVRTPLLRQRRAQVGLAAAVALGVGLGVGLPLLGNEGTADAQRFLVIKKDDGTILIDPESFLNPTALEQQLREYGVDVVVTTLPFDKYCRQPRFKQRAVSDEEMRGIFGWTDEADGALLGAAVHKEFGMLGQVLRPDRIPQGTTLVLTERIKGSDEDMYIAPVPALAEGPVGPCELLDVPPEEEMRGPVPMTPNDVTAPPGG